MDSITQKMKTVKINNTVSFVSIPVKDSQHNLIGYHYVDLDHPFVNKEYLTIEDITNINNLRMVN